MSITMKQRTFKVKLHQGDDLDQIAQLAQAAAALKPVGPSTSLEDSDYAAAAEAHDVFLAEADERAVVLDMPPVPRKVYQALLVQNPPREDDPGDQALGANAETIAEPLLLASLGEPFPEAEREAYRAALLKNLPPPECPERQAFLDSLNFAQFSHLVDEALSANRMVFAPKAPLLGSAHSPNSTATTDLPASSTG